MLQDLYNKVKKKLYDTFEPVEQRVSSGLGSMYNEAKNYLQPTSPKKNTFKPYDQDITDKYSYWGDVPDFNPRAKMLPVINMQSPATDRYADEIKQKAIDFMPNASPIEKVAFRSTPIVSGKQYFNPSAMPYYTGAYAVPANGRDYGSNQNFDKPWIAFDREARKSDIPTIQHELRHTIPLTNSNRNQRLGAGEEDWADNVQATRKPYSDPLGIDRVGAFRKRFRRVL